MARKPNKRASKFKRKEPNNYQDLEAMSLEDKGPKNYGKRKGGNAEAWYTRIRGISDPFSNLNWTYLQGLGVDYGSYTYQGTKYGINAKSLPGICAIPIAPVLGEASSASSPVNVAAMQMYSFVRHAVSGGKNYDPIDMIQYIYGMSNTYAWINYLERAYRYYDLWSDVNRYVPITLLKAMGVEPNSVIDNPEAVRGQINFLISKAAAFAVPADMSIFERQAFLFQEVYIEGASMRDQLYLFKPAGYYTYNEIGTVTAKTPALQWNPITGVHTIQELINYASSIIDSLLEAQSIGNISGDIKNAYGSNLIKLRYLEVGEKASPIYDAAVLEQIQNATSLRLYDVELGTSSIGGVIIGDINQNPGTAETANINYLSQNISMGTPEEYPSGSVVTKPLIQSYLQLFTLDRLLLSQNEKPTSATVLENTRLMVCSKVKGSTAQVLSGTEICGPVELYTTTPTGGYKTPLIYTTLMVNSGSDTGFAGVECSAQSLNSLLETLAPFHYAPNLMVINNLGNASTTTVSNYAKLSNYTLLHNSELEELHKACIMSEFYVASIGSVSIG
nr:capsid protein [Rat picobirnavirus]